MSFLVRNERAEPLVSADPHQNAIQLGDVTEEQINSEVELLQSTELLQGVVAGLRAVSRVQRRAGRSLRERVSKRLRRSWGKKLTVTPGAEELADYGGRMGHRTGTAACWC